MYIQHHQGPQCGPVLLAQLASHLLNNFLDVRVVHLKVVLYRSRRGDLKVHRLKDEVGGGGELYDLYTHQTLFLVVVQHSVHVLDPDGIHRPIEDEPLAVGQF